MFFCFVQFPVTVADEDILVEMGQYPIPNVLGDCGSGMY